MIGTDMNITAGTVIGIAEATMGIAGTDVNDCRLGLDLKTLAGVSARQCPTRKKS
jgi:hypothetical protein